MKDTLVAILTGFILVLVFFWGNVFGSKVNYTPGVGTNDFTDLNYPFRHFLSESIERGEFALWSSAISSGYPILAEGQIGGLYPLNLVLALFPTQISVNLTIVSSYFLLFIFSFAYLRQIKLSVWAATFGASLATFSGFAANELMHWGIFTSFTLFVGQLYFLEKFLEDKRMVWVLLMGILLGLSVLGGHPQIIFYSLIFLAFYWLAFWFSGEKLASFKKKRKRMALKLVVSGLLFLMVGLGIGAGQLLPQFEFTRNSTRASGLKVEAIERFNFPMSHLATFIRPFAKVDHSHTYEAFVNNGWPADERYIYMGLLGLVFALAGALRSFSLGRRALFFLTAAIVAMLLSFGRQFTAGYILTLPPFSFFRVPFRLIFVVNFSLAVLAAMAFARFSDWLEKRKVKRAASIAIMGVIFIMSFWDLRFQAKKLYPEVDAGNWYQEPETVDFLSQNLRNQERVTSQQYSYPTAKIFLESSELWDDPQIFVNLRNLVPIFNNLLYQIPKNIGAANSSGLKIARYNDLENEVYFRGFMYDEKGNITLTDSFMFLNRIMGVRFFLVTQPVKHFNLSQVQKIEFDTGQDPVYVYELFDYYPRVFMVPKAEKATSEEIKEHLLAVDFDPKRVIYLEEDTHLGAKGGYAASAQFVRYSEQEVEIQTQASGDGFLFLSDTWYPGWKAYVDGKETKIYRANYAFRAVQVPEGRHGVIFKYEPESFGWGLKITLATTAATIGGLVILVLWLEKGKKDKKLNRKR